MEVGPGLVSGLKGARSSRIRMTCQDFIDASSQDGKALLACGLQYRLVSCGEHRGKTCRNWMFRRELEAGWCPEVA